MVKYVRFRVFKGLEILETFEREIIIFHCPVVTEKSTNLGVKLSCPSLDKPLH